MHRGTPGALEMGMGSGPRARSRTGNMAQGPPRRNNDVVGDVSHIMNPLSNVMMLVFAVAIISVIVVGALLGAGKIK